MPAKKTLNARHVFDNRPGLELGIIQQVQVNLVTVSLGNSVTHVLIHFFQKLVDNLHVLQNSRWTLFAH